MKNMKLGIMLISLLILTGCSSQTLVKYQCADGSFVDSANSCPAVECQTNCPELDCLNCPPKIEYQTKEVEKKVYVDKPVVKYQCFNGDSEDNLEDCDRIK